jgi:hypothetical protein
MVTALGYRHVPTSTLAVLAQRLGKVWASPSTWYHLVRKFGWRHPRLRVHPAKPKVGLAGPGTALQCSETTTAIVAVTVLPTGSVTVKLTTNVPAALYTWLSVMWSPLTAPRSTWSPSPKATLDFPTLVDGETDRMKVVTWF